MSNQRYALAPYLVVTAGDMSLATVTSKATNILYLSTIAYQWNFSGTPTGAFSVQVSLDYAQDSQGNISNAGNWNTLTLTGSPAAAGSAGSQAANIPTLGFPWIRTVYTKSSGTGTLNVYISGKGF